jgi:hypothetical protein
MSHLSILFLAATLGQAPAESGWLNSVPPDADVVVRVRGLVPAKTDLVAMIKAMSPALGAQAEPALEQAVAAAKAQSNEQAVTEPFCMLLRGVAPENPASPPFAVIVKSTNYEGVLKSIAPGNEPAIKHLDAGYDSFNGPGGDMWYAFKGDGTVGFGPDKILIAGYAKPGDKSLGKTLSPALKKQFLGGDIGIYVNISVLTGRYAEQIAQAKQGLLAVFDQIGAQMGAGMVDFLKSMYGGMFDSIKEADVLALSLDFKAEGLGVDGMLTVKADSKAVKSIAGIQTSEAAGLGKLPADSSYYVYMNLDAKTFQSLQMMAIQMMSPGGKPSPELEATIAKERGRIETTGSVSFGNGGMKTFDITNLSDPKSFVAAFEGMMKLMQGNDSPMSFFKDVKSTPNVETYKGFSFTRIEMTVDYDKFAKLQPNNPAAVAGLKAMYGGDKLTTWLGVGETQMIKMLAPTWSDAKAQIDAYFKGEDGIGATAGFKATRAKLPKQANLLVLMSAQGFVRQLTAQISMMMPDALKQPPADMPKDPALIGFSLSPAGSNGFEFHLVVPSAVGPVFEKGLVPLFSNLKPPGNP